MTWLLAAIAGHLMNAAAFIIDKSLLTIAFKRSGTYAFVIGLISSSILVFLPAVSWNLTLGSWVAIGIFGSVFIFALWAFFEALSHAEASRIVPIVGSLIPVFTLIDSAVVVGERLVPRVLLGLAFLLVATVLLTRGGTKKQRLNVSTAGLCVLAAFLFAASSVSGKYAFEHVPFLDAFVLSRLFALALALTIPLISSRARKEIASLIRPGMHPNGPKPIHLLLMGAGQASGAVGFVGVQYAISLGSATVVNALQAVQYAAIVLVAWLGGKKLAALLKEDMTRRTLFIKGTAIGLVGIGLVLVGLPAGA
jgi:drug/metabolite transporter (DMT)-like permease